MTPWVLWPLGIPIWLFVGHETYFRKMDFHLIYRSHAEFSFSCIQWKRHPTMDPKSKWHQGVYEPGEFKLDRLMSVKPIFAKEIPTYITCECSISLFLHAEKRAARSGPYNWVTFVPAKHAVDAWQDPGRVRGPRDALHRSFQLERPTTVVVRLAESSAIIFVCDKKRNSRPNKYPQSLRSQFFIWVKMQ